MSGDSAFPQTQWSLVFAVRDGGEKARRALEDLCSRYWFPIYGFIRTRGRGREDAEDFTQGFFADLLASGALNRADPARGRLRTFLLAVLSDFLADAARHAGREKRGGGAIHVSFDTEEAEQQLRTAFVDTRDPEALYHRAWSLTVLATARVRMREDFAQAGKAAQLAAIEPHIEASDDAISYRDLAATTGQSETALRLQVYRARQKLRSLIEAEITSTVAAREDAEDELRFLTAVLAGG